MRIHILTILLLGWCGTALLMHAAELPSLPATFPAKLAKESIDCCKGSICSTPPPPQKIIQMVNAAAKLLSKEGESAFKYFRGRDSKFIFCGTYIWIHDSAGVMRMHPIDYKLEGTRILNKRDPNGKLPVLEMNVIAQKYGAGWVEYEYYRPGSDVMENKVSYVKRVKYKDEIFIVGCGIYNTTLEKVLQQLKDPKNTGEHTHSTLPPTPKAPDTTKDK